MGSRGRAPAGGPGGGAPGGYRVFSKYIRAFKMVVRSDRICNFSHWNFAYRALVGGEGCGVISFSVILRWPFWILPTWKHNWLRTSEPIFSYFALKKCDSSVFCWSVAYFYRYNKSLCWFIYVRDTMIYDLIEWRFIPTRWKLEKMYTWLRASEASEPNFFKYLRWKHTILLNIYIVDKSMFVGRIIISLCS